ncbi:MAG: PIN domain-containing protein [Candidatus Geothermarchaeales archaeon]
MKKELSGAFALDASALIELVHGTAEGTLLRDAMIDGLMTAKTHEMAMTELRYILCRNLGRDEAKERVEKLLASGYVTVEQTSELVEAAADYKCERAIALPDSFSIALGKLSNTQVLFAKREEDLAKEMEKDPFDIEIRFLQEYATS